MDPLEAEDWLKDQEFVFLLDGVDTICYLLLMIPLWAVRTQVQRWQVLLDPVEVTMAQLQNAPEQQDLHRWRLSILEASELGLKLVPADYSLWKGGFKVHSYLPWHNSTPEDAFNSRASATDKGKVERGSLYPKFAYMVSPRRLSHLRMWKQLHHLMSATVRLQGCYPNPGSCLLRE
ncbi:hypothetical protein A6R68_00490 [Neotoma lepida]|uniref:Uncharacterized protein n=1 Tax=Neotoma lepida TaxID=56216 RepID=A0A1A6GXD2_NEOLE|nr:hypothetical protein A6R68_00490 [Neotoma lepida]